MRSNRIVICALAIVPAIAVGQGGGAQAQTGSDTGQAKQAQGQDTVTSSAGGSIATNRNVGLSSEQVKQLQQALNATGCNTGSVDGIVGPKTRNAIRCAEQERNLSGNNLNELLRAFGFRFTASNASEGNAAAHTTPAGRAVRGNERQTGGENAGRIRPLPDSSAGDTSRTQQGMQRDTSTMNMRDTTQNMRDTTHHP